MPAVPAEVTSLLSDFQSSLEVFKGQLKNAFATLDLTTVAAILLVVAGAIIVYDLLVYALASSSTSRSMMVTPFLAKIASEAWQRRDELGFSNLIDSRSVEDFPAILEALTLAADKYEKEETDLQSEDKKKKE
ncbi:uncharacterized protein LOC135220234 [Macrobrachium nipponense]|uniref:uncharacterized protein LOC135220234 n=1 Tax=Macrobrachium nipponense TaxID=159736 RepID=UPI0030C8B9E8